MQQKRKAPNRSSKLDKSLGDHTTSILVAILFVVTLAAITSISLTKSDISKEIVLSLCSLLAVLAGFFVSNATKERK